MAGHQTCRLSRLDQRRGSRAERSAEPPQKTVHTRTPDASCIASSLLFLPLMGNSTLLSVPSDRERRVISKILIVFGVMPKLGNSFCVPARDSAGSTVRWMED